MRYTKKMDWRLIRFPSTLLALSLIMAFLSAGTVRSDTQRSEVRKTETKKPVSQDDSNPAKDLKDLSTLSPQEKKQWAISLLEETLAGANHIKPVEYSILTKVEAALMLLEFDRPRSVSILRDAIKATRELLAERGISTKMDYRKDSKERRLWSSIIRKIGAVSPDLVGELLLENSSAGNLDKSISGEWTEEARAMIGVASSHIEKNPALAIRIVEQTLPLGRVDLSSFLSMLSRHDSALAEQFAITLIDRFRDSSTRGVLWDLIRFVWVPERSTRLKE